MYFPSQKKKKNPLIFIQAPSLLLWHSFPTVYLIFFKSIVYKERKLNGTHVGVHEVYVEWFNGHLLLIHLYHSTYTS